MRDIKFRAWDRDQGKMFNWEPVQFEEEGLFDWEDVNNSDKLVFNQYTGLKDKNGKEIYEGDVFCWGVHYCEIVWDIYGFVAKNQLGRVFGLNAIASLGEIVGSVYENSALLNGQQGD